VDNQPTVSNEKELPSFGTALDAINELEVFVLLCWEGLGYAEVVKEIVDWRAKMGATSEYIAKRIEHAEKLETFAATQKPLGFPYLYGLAAIRLWTILESFSEDLFIDLTVVHAEVRSLPKIRGLKGPLIEFANAPASKQAELLLNLLMGELAAALKRGVGRFECVFEAIELSGPVDYNVRRSFVELQEVRNVVAHRRGIADERLVTNCPWYGAKVGELLRITPRAFEKYILSAHWYLVEISRRVLIRYPSEADKTLDPSLEAHLDLQHRLSTTLHRLFGVPNQA
jgi:hypothetical protein